MGFQARDVYCMQEKPGNNVPLGAQYFRQTISSLFRFVSINVISLTGNLAKIHYAKNVPFGT